MTSALTGYRVLVVEDEYFIAAEIEDALTQAGAQVVGPISGVEEALRQVRGDGFDLAVLDLNLRGDLAYPVADALQERGVPFLFASAYQPTEMPASYRLHRLLSKPYDSRILVEALAEILLDRPTHSRTTK
jgi:CheY-like chemotaxis protein